MDCAAIAPKVIGQSAEDLARFMSNVNVWSKRSCVALSKKIVMFARLYIQPKSLLDAMLDEAAKRAYRGHTEQALELLQRALRLYQNKPRPASPERVLRAAAECGDLNLARSAIGAHVDAADFNGTTPLMVAALHQRHAMVRWLLAAGADPDATDVFGETYHAHGRSVHHT